MSDAPVIIDTQSETETERGGIVGLVEMGRPL